ncbi:AraC family transcriptional regulator [uncultured Dokdonia sp.]|uniref:helix-turn-helix transcriptional regulator n=1 Tax=uncultured Dokdonia sp. TaxID=575653 RepID=UPI00262F7DD3|nr:AraC family transcriptional regulator [uncultured Dokdonia sp.]
MNIIHLPDHSSTENKLPFYLIDYHTSEESRKQMVSLKLNTFSFLQEGYKEVFSDRNTIAIENANFLLMKSGHCLMTEKLANINDSYRSILFFFSNESLLRFVQKHNIPTPKTIQQSSIYSFEYDAFLKTFVSSLVHINTLKPEVKLHLLSAKFEELLLYLKETKGNDFIFSLIHNTDSKFQHFIEIVESNKLNKLTLKELSFLSNMSVSSFKREFTKHFKSSPSKWFQEKRLEQAALLLKNTTNRPSDIFEEIGYESLSNFIQAFKTKFGVTPKQYQIN